MKATNERKGSKTPARRLTAAEAVFVFGAAALGLWGNTTFTRALAVIFCISALACGAYTAWYKYTNKQ